MVLADLGGKGLIIFYYIHVHVVKFLYINISVDCILVEI